MNLIESQTDYKKGRLMYSFNANDIEQAKEKLTGYYYGSKKDLTMYSLSKGFKYFYLLNEKGEMNQKTIICNKENTTKYQLRYFD